MGCAVVCRTGDQSSSLSHFPVPPLSSPYRNSGGQAPKTPEKNTLLFTLLDFNCVESKVLYFMGKISAYLISNCSYRTSHFSETVTERQDVLECGTRQLHHYSVSSTMFAGEIWLRYSKKCGGTPVVGLAGRAPVSPCQADCIIAHDAI